MLPDSWKKWVIIGLSNSVLRRGSRALWAPETPGFEQKLQEMWALVQQRALGMVSHRLENWPLQRCFPILFNINVTLRTNCWSCCLPELKVNCIPTTGSFSPIPHNCPPKSNLQPRAQITIPIYWSLFKKEKKKENINLGENWLLITTGNNLDLACPRVTMLSHLSKVCLQYIK